MDNQILTEADYTITGEFFEDDTPVTEDNAEPNESLETQEQSTEDKQPEFDLRDLEIKHFKDVKKLKDFTPDELKEYVQKGLDYDRVKEQRKQFEEKSNELGTFEKLATEYGYSAKEFAEMLHNNRMQSRAENNETSLEFEQRAYELENKARQIEAYETEQKNKSAQTEQIDAFIREYPNVDPNALPKEVYEAVLNGESLKQAYAVHQNKQLQAELERYKKLVENVKSSPVTSTTNNGGTGNHSTDEIGDIFDRL